MDPLLHAARQFGGALSVHLGEPTTHIMRLHATLPHRDDMVKALRLLEWQEANRWPFVVVEHVTPHLVLEAVVACYAALAEGLSADGLRPAPLKPAEVALAAQERALYCEDELSQAAITAEAGATLKQASGQLLDVAGAHLDGLALVLAPAVAPSPRAYQQLVSHLCLYLGENTKLLAYDACSDLAEFQPTVVFEVDQNELVEHLGEVSAAVAVEAPERAEVPPGERALVAGQAPLLPSDDAAMNLRRLVGNAGQHLAKGEFEAAAKQFRRATTLCRLSAASGQEAVLWIATGSAHLSAEHSDRAAHAFRQALAVVRENDLGAPLHIQALLGGARVHQLTRRWQAADAAYAAALEAADAAAVPTSLVIELWRQRAVCAFQRGRLDDGVEHADRGLAAAEQRQPDDGTVANAADLVTTVAAAVGDGDKRVKSFTARLARLEARGV